MEQTEITKSSPSNFKNLRGAKFSYFLQYFHHLSFTILGQNQENAQRWPMHTSSGYRILNSLYPHPYSKHQDPKFL